MKKLSLALATYNEELNIVDCIKSCKGLVDEVVVVDGSSIDNTASLALTEGATVIRTHNLPMFHINKQKAIDACTGEWILQLDADERVTSELAEEIKKIITMSDKEIEKYQDNLKEKELFERHQKLVQSNIVASASMSLRPSESEGKQSQNKIATSPEPALSKIEGAPRNDKDLSFQPSTLSHNAFFIPRLNYFLGGYLRSGGVYPDGVIRLIRKGKAHLPCKSVHELMEVEGKTGWLANPLIHKDSPTFKRYLERNSRYIDHLVEELKHCHSDESRNPEKYRSLDFARDDTMGNKINLFFNWVFIKPTFTFFSLLIRHKGILDGWRGVVFAFFSSIRFARAYFRCIDISKIRRRF